MGEINERKCRNGNEICQTTEGPDAGLFNGESLFDVLEKDFDLPTVEVGVSGENSGVTHRFVSPITVDEVGGVEIDGGAVEGGRNNEDRKVCFVGWENPWRQRTVALVWFVGERRVVCVAGLDFITWSME